MPAVSTVLHDTNIANGTLLAATLRGSRPGVQSASLIMVALCNRADHYIFILFLLLSYFFFLA